MLETVDVLSNWTATTINAVRTVGVVGWETYSEVLFSNSNSNPNHGSGDNGTEHNPRQTPASDPLPHGVLILPLPRPWAISGLYADPHEAYVAAPPHHATLLRRYWEVVRAHPEIKFSVMNSHGLPAVLPRLGRSFNLI